MTLSTRKEGQKKIAFHVHIIKTITLLRYVLFFLISLISAVCCNYLHTQLFVLAEG